MRWTGCWPGILLEACVGQRRRKQTLQRMPDSLYRPKPGTLWHASAAVWPQPVWSSTAALRQQVSFIRCLKRWNHLTVHGLSAGTAWMKSSTEPEKKCMSQIAGLFLRQTAHAWSFSGSRSWCTLCSATFVELCTMIIHTAS